MQYIFQISGTLESDLTLEDVEERLDIWLLKYWVSELVPKWDNQSISLEWYSVMFDKFIINEI